MKTFYFVDSLSKSNSGELEGDFNTFEDAEKKACDRLLNGYKNVVITKAIAQVELPKETFTTTHLA